jgi:phage recombination protein Bet
MDNALERVQPTTIAITDDDVDLIRDTIAKDLSPRELELFLQQARRTGLDPLSRQIYAFKSSGRVSICATIDGLRLIADRTGRYAPGPTEITVESGSLMAASVCVRKYLPQTSEWIEVTETAYLVEYQANTPVWKKMPKVMLAKCAESRALRRAFPAELSGIYSSEEMDQARAPVRTPARPPAQRQLPPQPPQATYEPPLPQRQTPPPRTVQATLDPRAKTREVVVDRVEEFAGHSNGKDWLKYTIVTEDGWQLSTFTDSLAAQVRDLAANGQPMVLHYENRGKYTNLVAVTECREPGCDDDLEPPPISDEYAP